MVDKQYQSFLGIFTLACKTWHNFLSKHPSLSTMLISPQSWTAVVELFTAWLLERLVQQKPSIQPEVVAFLDLCRSVEGSNPTASITAVILKKVYFMWKAAADDETEHGLMYFCHPFNLWPPIIWWGKRSKGSSIFCILSAGNSICQNWTLGSGLERDGMAVAIISPVPRRTARLWSRARAGQEGRSPAEAGGQLWVGCAT